MPRVRGVKLPCPTCKRQGFTVLLPSPGTLRHHQKTQHRPTMLTFGSSRMPSLDYYDGRIEFVARSRRGVR